MNDNMTPSYEKLFDLQESDEFVKDFCRKTLVLLDEFVAAYEEALAQNDFNKLSDLTHKVSPTMRWLGMEKYVQLIKSYNKLPIGEPEFNKRLMKEIILATQQIKHHLIEKIESFGMAAEK